MVDEFDFQPYRRLQPENRNDVDVTTSSMNTTVPSEFENLILDDRGASWQAIYISVGLTLFQTIFFLAIFEIGRRNKYVESVFDRRRIRHPKRVPAPLMQRKGCCRGWLAFEWWRVRLTDEAYTRESWDEHRLLLMEASSKQRTHALLQNEIDDMFVKEAEANVYKTSPICAQEAAKKDVESAPPIAYQQRNYDDDSMEISNGDDSGGGSSSSSSNSTFCGDYLDVEAATQYGYEDDTKDQRSNAHGYAATTAQQSSNPYGYGDDALQQSNNPYGYSDDQQARNSHSNPYGYGDEPQENGNNNDPYGYGNMEIENEDSSASVESDRIQHNHAVDANENGDPDGYGDMQMVNEDSTTSFGYEQQNRNIETVEGNIDDESYGYGDMQVESQDSTIKYGKGEGQQPSDVSITLEGGPEDSDHRISSSKTSDARPNETIPLASAQQPQSKKKGNKDESKGKAIEDDEHLKEDIIAQIQRVEAELEATRKAATCSETLKANASRKGTTETDSLRLTFFTGEAMPHDVRSADRNASKATLSQQAPLQNQALFNLDNILGTITSISASGTAGDKRRPQLTTRPAFNLDEILNNVTSSKKQSSLTSTRSTFDVNSLLSTIASSTGITKLTPTGAVIPQANFSLDNILRNVSVSNGVAENDFTKEASKSSQSLSSSAFSLDNIGVSTSTSAAQKAKTDEATGRSLPSAQTASSLDNIVANVGASANVSKKDRDYETARNAQPPLQSAFSLDNIVGSLGASTSISKKERDFVKAESAQLPLQSDFILDNIVGNVASSTPRILQKRPMEKSQSTAEVPAFNVDSVMDNLSGSTGTSAGSHTSSLSISGNDFMPTTDTAPEIQDLSNGASKHTPKLVPMKQFEEETNPVPKKRRGRRGSTSFESGSVRSQDESQSSSAGSAPSDESRPASQRRGRRGSTSFETRNVPTTSTPSHSSTLGDEDRSFGTLPVSGTPDPSRAKRSFSMGDIPHGGTESTAPLTVTESLSDHSKSSQSKRKHPRGFSVSGTAYSDGFLRLSATGASVTNYVKTQVLMISDHSEDAEDSSLEDGNFIATKVTRRKLTPEEKEQLRCIGLDAFMTLRFLKFGFDVFFWPMVLSIFTLIPVYKTAAFHADVVGFFSATIISLAFSEEYWRYWIVMAFASLHYCYILRRLWIEWEVFLPLRYDFLENGDFEKERYKEQYRKTCLVEFIPKEYKHDKLLHEFFDTISPGEIERAEVLLNTEYLRSLIKEKMKHIVAYEDVYAKKVHTHADYLRTLRTYQWGEAKKTRCCRSKKNPQEPSEPMVRVEKKTQAFDGSKAKKEYTHVCALNYHFENIQRLNREIDDEYMRLAQAQRRQVAHNRESLLSKWLGLRYVFTGQDTSRLHSSTAFVQFKTFAAKQHAIQCNITGMHNYMVVTPVPEVRDLIWDNMHVSRSLIDTRKAWANLLLTGGLFLWSTIIFSIRSVNDISTLIEPITDSTAVAAFLDVYAPALIVEGLVRMIPNLIKALCILIRFKAHSERDHYVLRWYFGYRLLTFIFLIIGGTTLIESSDRLVRDPIQFIKNLAGNVASNAQFFISYVIVSGGIQVFFRLSQWHNLALFLIVHLKTKEESLSQRRLEKMEKSIKTFHLDEFIPLFLFIFMVGALYGFIAPLAGIFVAGFFLLARKVFTYMTLFIYGNHFEGGGFLFYTLSDILFYVMYMIILVVVGYFSIRGTGVQAGIFSIMLFVVIAVHRDVRNTFVEPSKTLSLAKARAFDESQDTRSLRERKFEQYTRAKKEYDAAVRKEEAEGQGNVSRRLFKRLLPRSSSGDFSLDSFDSSHHDDRRSMTDTNSLEDAIQRFNDRYNGEDAFDDDDVDDVENNNGSPSKQNNSFFIYRQPALNRATWEVAPKPYRDSVERDEAAEVWGDERPEQTRKVARQRRASIAMYYGG